MQPSRTVLGCMLAVVHGSSEWLWPSTTPYSPAAQSLAVCWLWYMGQVNGCGTWVKWMAVALKHHLTECLQISAYILPVSSTYVHRATNGKAASGWIFTLTAWMMLTSAECFIISRLMIRRTPVLQTVKKAVAATLRYLGLLDTQASCYSYSIWAGHWLTTESTSQHTVPVFIYIVQKSSQYRI